MNKFILPHQYNLIAYNANVLVNTHRSVNDKSSINTMTALAYEKIQMEFLSSSVEEMELLNEVVLLTKAQKQEDQFLEKLKGKS